LFELDHGSEFSPSDKGWMGTMLFTCPVTGMSVQHWLDDDSDAQHGEYETVVCNAYTRLHFINRKTGRLLGQKEELD
jgi:hypothetical protein